MSYLAYILSIIQLFLITIATICRTYLAVDSEATKLNSSTHIYISKKTHLILAGAAHNIKE